MSKTLESRDALFCLCCCTAFGGSNRLGARREARLLRRIEAVCDCYEQRAAESKHDMRVLFCSNYGNSRSFRCQRPSCLEVPSLLAIPPRASTSLYSRRTKPLSLSTAFSKNLVSNTYPGRGVARSLNMHPEGASNCPWGNHRALLQFTYAQGASYACNVDHASVFTGR